VAEDGQSFGPPSSVPLSRQPAESLEGGRFETCATWIGLTEIELLERIWDEKRRGKEPAMVVVKKAPLWLKIAGYVWVYLIRPILIITWELTRNFDAIVVPLGFVWLLFPFIAIGISLLLGTISIDFQHSFDSWMKTVEWPLNKFGKTLFILCIPGLPFFMHRMKKLEEEEWREKFAKDPIRAAYEKGRKDGFNDGFIMGGHWD